MAALATSALAHSKSQSTTPADAATVASVDTIEIRFQDPMLVTAISLTGPEGAFDLERETGMDPVTEFRAVPATDLPSGAYTVDWRGLSVDGHPMQGTFSFSVGK
jgi:hypothetical protein